MTDDLPTNGSPATRSDLGWLEKLINLKFKQVNDRFDQLETQVEKHIPICSRRFDIIETRLDAPAKWVKGRLTLVVGEILKQTVRLAFIAGAIVLGIHFT
jgi:hypothetical protein